MQNIDNIDSILDSEINSESDSEIIINIPRHVAVIMDGNGRWAQSRGKVRILGHKSSVKRVKSLVQESYKRGVKALSLFAFSTENWSRPKLEVSSLMMLCQQAITDEIDELNDRNIKVVFIGDLSLLPNKLQKMIDKAHDLTKNNDAMLLQICLNYGGRWDILEATKSIVSKAQSGELGVNDITEDAISENMPSLGGDIDLLIRTSGEARISNFMLWQAAYAELYFTDVFFPDFDEKQIALAFDYYTSRKRRFGGLSV